MGNQPSSDGHGHGHDSRHRDGHHHGSSSGTSSSGTRQLKGFMRSTGVLGLSRSELDERCKPSGLYPSCQWEDKAIRRLIGDGKLAPRLKGSESRSSASQRECPICFLHYAEVNMTKCCQAHICTECYLQVRPQKDKSACCPFCNHNRVSVTVASEMDAEAIMEREEDEQRVIEAKIRACAKTTASPSIPATAASTDDDEQNETDNKQSLEDDPSSAFLTPCKLQEDATKAAASAFGSSLEKNERVAAMRSRTSSSFSDSNEPLPDDQVLASLAITPEERRALEDEMRAQHSHPLSLRIEAEAEERRVQNERDWYRSQGGRLLELRARSLGNNRRGRLYQSRLASDPGMSLLFQPESSSASTGPGATGHHHHQPRRRDWNQIVDAFERGGNGEVNSLDDLVVLEAAMILSMEEEARRRGNGTASGARSGNESAEDGTAGDNTFEASRHANEGFPLLRSLLAGRQSSAGLGTTREAIDAPATGSSPDDPSEQLLSVARGLNSRRRGRNSSAMRGYRAASMNSALDTASLLMRGISEEEQVAMAIAASLQDQQESGTNEIEEVNSEASSVQSENEGAANVLVGDAQEEQLDELQQQDGQLPFDEPAGAEMGPPAEDVSSTASDYESTSEQLDGEDRPPIDSEVPAPSREPVVLGISTETNSVQDVASNNTVEE